jgi:hypothetical protein
MHSLHVDWLRFLPALVLLLTPVRILQGESVHFRAVSRGWNRHWPQILGLGHHAVDFARAALGSWLLIGSLSIPPDVHGLAAQMPFLLQGIIRVLAVFLQTVICKELDSANAPFAFVIGLLIGGHSPLSAIFAIALAIALAAGTRTPAAFFPLLAVSFLGAGFLFGQTALAKKTVFGSFAAMLPWLWSLLFNRTLLISYRASRSGPSRAPVAPPAGAASDSD